MQPNLPNITFDELFDNAFSEYLDNEFAGGDEDCFHLVDVPNRNANIDERLWRKLIARHLNSYCYT